MKTYITLFISLFTLLLSATAQTGITVGPPRVFFVVDAGQNQSQTVDVTNPSKDFTLDLAVSFEDWQYNLFGENELAKAGTLANSCAAWVSVSEPFFSLKPGETKRLNVNMAVPQAIQYSQAMPVHTVMLFVTQLNPRQGIDKEGANIKIAVRSGIKLYHRFNGKNNTDLDITNVTYNTPDSAARYLAVDYTNTGNVWLEGRLSVELINQEGGKKIMLDQQGFYTLPNDQRRQLVGLPPDLAKGTYLATILLNFGDKDQIKVAELEFDYD